MNTSRFFRLGLVIFLLGGLFACQPDDPQIDISTPTADYSPEVTLRWFYLFEEIDRYAPGYRPPAAARALAYIGLAGYEAAVPGMPEYNSFAGHYRTLRVPTADPNLEYHWPTAVHSAYNTIFRRFYFPYLDAHLLSKISNLNLTVNREFEAQLEPRVYERSIEFGEAVANAVYEWSTSDIVGHGANENPRPASYIPPKGPGLWEPTKPDFTPALFPYWGGVRTFALQESELITEPPIQWSEDPSSEMYRQAKEVEEWVNRIDAGQDEEHRWIGEFWSDDFYEVTFTPAGRWVAITNQVMNIERPSLARAVEIYTKVGMALCDAGISVWKSKFHYNLERPVHYINRNWDANWETNMNNPFTGITGITPEFPAYPSGHSGFGGAAGYILEQEFGANYTMTDYCHKDRAEFRGQPRTFRSFTHMAEENAFSRVPLGVHFRMDCEVGLNQGYLAGQRVEELPWRN